jgi:hypothetical protein
MKQIVISFADVGNWLFTPLELFEGFSIAPIMIMSFGVLSAYLVIAIAKWLIN